MIHLFCLRERERERISLISIFHRQNWLHPGHYCIHVCCWSRDRHCLWWNSESLALCILNQWCDHHSFSLNQVYIWEASSFLLFYIIYIVVVVVIGYIRVSPFNYITWSSYSVNSVVLWSKSSLPAVLYGNPWGSKKGLGDSIEWAHRNMWIPKHSIVILDILPFILVWWASASHMGKELV